MQAPVGRVENEEVDHTQREIETLRKVYDDLHAKSSQFRKGLEELKVWLLYLFSLIRIP